MKKVTGRKAGELFLRACKAQEAARKRLLEMCGAASFNFPSHKVQFVAGKPRVSGVALLHEGNVYEIENKLQAHPGDEKGDPSLICYRVVKPDTRQMTLFVFAT